MTCPRAHRMLEARLGPAMQRWSPQKGRQEQILKKLGNQVRNSLTLGQLASSKHKRSLGVFGDCSDLPQQLGIVCWR